MSRITAEQLRRRYVETCERLDRAALTAKISEETRWHVMMVINAAFRQIARDLGILSQWHYLWKEVYALTALYDPDVFADLEEL